MTKYSRPHEGKESGEALQLALEVTIRHTRIRAEALATSFQLVSHMYICRHISRITGSDLAWTKSLPLCRDRQIFEHKRLASQQAGAQATSKQLANYGWLDLKLDWVTVGRVHAMYTEFFASPLCQTVVFMVLFVLVFDLSFYANTFVYCWLNVLNYRSSTKHCY